MGLDSPRLKVKKMNVYDFDKTIYDGDSTVDFYFYCLKRYPKILLRLPSVAWYAILYMFQVYTKTQFKEKFFMFLKDIKNIDRAVKFFWKKHEKNIKGFNKKGGVVISASPEFLLAPICEKLDMSLIASRVDKHTGKYTGENCHGQEKVRRFKEIYGNKKISEFYSDSLSDKPLAEMAKSAFVVQKREIIPWDEYKPSKIKDTFFTRQFLSFVFIGAANTIICTLFSYIYSSFIEPSIAFALGYISSLIISYFLNSCVTFKESLAVSRFVKYIISYIPNFLIQQVVVTLCIEAFGLYKLVAYVLAAVIGVPVTFAIMKIFAFRRRK